VPAGGEKIGDLESAAGGIGLFGYLNVWHKYSITPIISLGNEVFHEVNLK
jgi:hypothetical protein